MGRVALALAAGAGLAVGAALSGCATVRARAPETAQDPWGQRALAELLEAAFAEVRPHLAGRRVAVVVRASDPAVAAYAARLAEETVWSSGARVAVGEGEAVLELEVRSAGRERAERTLMVPLSQNLRLPLYYGQHQAGELHGVLTLREGERARRWVVSGRRTGRQSYAFRVLGPF